jgi:hypothetical protein
MPESALHRKTLKQVGSPARRGGGSSHAQEKWSSRKERIMEDNYQSDVVILTSHYIITAQISLAKGARLTDYMHGTERFFALTNAQVRDRHGGRAILDAPFMDVNRDMVEMILPADGASLHGYLYPTEEGAEE